MSQRGRIDIAAVISYTGLDIIATKTEISQGTISPDNPTGPTPQSMQTGPSPGSWALRGPLLLLGGAPFI